MQFLDCPNPLTSWIEDRNQNDHNSPNLVNHQEVASLQPTYGSSSDPNLSYATTTTNTDQQVPTVIKTKIPPVITLTEVKKLIDVSVEAATKKLRAEIESVNTKLFQERHHTREDYLHKFVKVNYKLDQQESFIESLCETHKKFAQKFSSFIQRVDTVSAEVKKVQSSSSTDYSTLNQMFDLVDELKDEVEIQKLQMALYKEDSKESKIFVDDIKSELQSVLDYTTQLTSFNVTQENTKAHLKVLSREIKKLEETNMKISTSVELLETNFLNSSQQTSDKHDKLVTDVQKMSDGIKAQLQYLDKEISEVRQQINDEIQRKENPVTPNVPSKSESKPEPTHTSPHHPVILSPGGASTSSVTPIDLTTLLESSSNSKPSFPKYNPQVMTLTKWRALCIMKLASSKHHYYNSFVTTNESGKNVLDTSLAKDKKAVLFNLIHDALPASQLNLEFITDTMIENADGIALWEQCSKRFAPTKKGYYDREELKEEFKSMVKEDKETNENFLKRLEKKANELTREGIELRPHVKALTLLKGLRSECLKTPIVSIMQEEGSGEYADWIKEDDLKHTLNKAESRQKFEKAATAMLCPKPINTYPTSTYKSALQKSTQVSQSKSTASPTDPCTQLSAELKGCISQQARINKIFEWRNKDKEYCILCPSLKTHKFLRCDKLCQLCETNNWTEALVETKLRNRAFAEKKLQEEANSTTTSSVAKSKVDSQVAARKAAIEAQQAATDQHPSQIEDDDDGNSQDTNSTIDSNE